jgi:hypothetical protein
VNAAGKDHIGRYEDRAFDAIGGFALTRFTTACTFSRKRRRGTTAEWLGTESATDLGDW